MIGNLRDRWEYTWTDIWEPLGSLLQAPRDLYVQLYRACVDNLRRRPKYLIIEQIVNSPEMAYSAFQSIRGSQFRDELTAVQFLERVYELIDISYSRILRRRYAEYV